jgi:hypothetical protein
VSVDEFIAAGLSGAPVRPEQLGAAITPPGVAQSAAVDVEHLADLVYELLRNDVRLARLRGAAPRPSGGTYAR